MVHTPVKKLTLMSILTAIALIIFIIEAMIPLPIPIPGMKLGLANAVTLFALFFGASRYLNTVDVLAILLCRILLGAIFTGRPVVVVYSLAGGLLGFAAQVVMKRFVSEKQIWVCGAAGAVFHNIGQILAAVLLTGTPMIAAYLPVLIITGVFTGVITGFAAQFTLARIQRIHKDI